MCGSAPPLNNQKTQSAAAAVTVVHNDTIGMVMLVVFAICHRPQCGRNLDDGDAIMVSNEKSKINSGRNV